MYDYRTKNICKFCTPILNVAVDKQTYYKNRFIACNQTKHHLLIFNYCLVALQACLRQENKVVNTNL